MAEQGAKIIGVDFSGAKNEKMTKKTWICEGELTGNDLTIKTCDPITRKELTKKLKNLAAIRSDMVVAMDFPFGVPKAFAMFWFEKRPQDFCCQKPETMRDLWAAALRSNHNLDKLRCSFLKRYGAMLRNSDSKFGGPLSPLSKAINMFPMTFEGMKLLGQLRACDNLNFRVPPLEGDGQDGPVLLEIMPGVLLRSFGIQAEKYKGKAHLKCREKMVSELRMKEKTGIDLCLPNDSAKKCTDNDDCLDSLVAAIGAAQWVKNKGDFLHPRKVVPQEEEIELARLEGWLYSLDSAKLNNKRASN